MRPFELVFILKDFEKRVREKDFFKAFLSRSFLFL